MKSTKRSDSRIDSLAHSTVINFNQKKNKIQLTSFNINFEKYHHNIKTKSELFAVSLFKFYLSNKTHVLICNFTSISLINEVVF